MKPTWRGEDILALLPVEQDSITGIGAHVFGGHPGLVSPEDGKRVAGKAPELEGIEVASPRGGLYGVDVEVSGSTKRRL